MPRLAKRLVLLVSICLLVASVPRTGLAVESSTETGVGRAARVAVDIFPMRFGGFLRLVVGSVMVIPATVFSAIAMPFERNPNIFSENAELYLREPFRSTFLRPLGEDFSGY